MKAITIAGNIGRDATTRQTQGGDAVTGFSVAVEERTGRDKRTVWFDVSIWGRRGEALAPYLTKGSRVAVSGDLSTREHEGKTYLTVRAEQVTLMGGKPEGPPRNTAADPDRSRAAPPADDLDDQIPF